MAEPNQPRDLDELADTVDTRDDLVAFLHEFEADLRRNPGEWENGSLPTFLEALARWTESMDNYYLNFNKPVPAQPSWKTFAEMMMAARIYE